MSLLSALPDTRISTSPLWKRQTVAVRTRQTGQAVRRRVGHAPGAICVEVSCHTAGSATRQRPRNCASVTGSEPTDEPHTLEAYMRTRRRKMEAGTLQEQPEQGYGWVEEVRSVPLRRSSSGCTS